MDPVHATAARHLSTARKSAQSEIDAFYDENAFESLHAVRLALGQIVELQSAACGCLARAVRQGLEIASTRRQA